MRKPIGEPSTVVPTDKAGLIKWLVEKGISLGFHAEANYISPENNIFAEAAWPLNHGQKPIFTFTVEEANPIKLAANARAPAMGRFLDRAQILDAHLCLPKRIR